jgi:signal transduction histidine kinase
LLAEASRALGSSLDYETTLTRVADYVVPTLGDWCAVDILGDDGTVRRLAARHSDPARVEVAANLRRQFPPDPAAPRGVPRVLRTGEAEFYPDIAELLAATARDSNHLDLLRGLGLRSAIIVPVKARERTIGAITLASAESGRRYDETDLRVAEDLAYRVAVAVENSRLYQEAHAARADAERARADAEQANKAKSDFLASMSHELRTPLNAIGGYVQLLWEGLPGPVNEKQREYLSRARRSQAHLLGLINNVLNFAKLEAGQLQYEITLVPLRESLAEVDDLIAPQVRAKGLSYDIQVCKTNVIMRADRAKVRQILLNLVSNAVKFTAPGGNVAIDCGMRGSDAFIVVRDSGIGIAPERLGDVFEPFVQLEKGASREGTGLGLSISRELARAMQGDLTVESELGKGSAFTLTLPVAADSATSDAATADAATRDAARCAAGSERPDGVAQSG